MSAVPPAGRRFLGIAALAFACAAGSPVLAQPRAEPAPPWSELQAQHQNLLAPFAAQWDQWTESERRAWLSLSARFPAMPPAEQLRARERIRQWAELDESERQTARANFGMARRIPEEQRIEQWQRYRSMTPEQRSVLREHGSTGNTAARFAGERTGLAPEAARPLVDPATSTPPAAAPASPRGGAGESSPR
ncbi:MAG: DUF3106 domain-containing protein [Burkholderiaceae bacterium]